MKFELSTTKYQYFGEEKKDLMELGFTFRLETSPLFAKDRYVIEEKPLIELKTLEELMEFVSKWGQVVLTKDSIEIYNDYRD